MSDVLRGRIVMVTGASSGIGEGIALALAAEGVTVVVAARRRERLAQLVPRLREAGGDGVAVALDVLDPAAIAEAFAETARVCGKLDGLVNNAGVLGRGAAGDRDAGEWRASIEANLLGPMLVTRAALPLLRASAAAHVVNVSSTAARSPNAGSAPYGAAKGGLNAFTESLRKELAPAGIRVTVVLPGLVESEFYAHVPDDVRRPWMREIVPLQPSDVGRAVAFVMAQPPHVSISELVIRPTAQLG